MKNQEVLNKKLKLIIHQINALIQEKEEFPVEREHEMLDTKSACQFLGVSSTTFQRMITRVKTKSFKRGLYVYYFPEDLTVMRKKFFKIMLDEKMRKMQGKVNEYIQKNELLNEVENEQK